MAATSTASHSPLSADECLYTSCYCEENVWKMCERIRQKDRGLLAKFKVMFISNPTRTVAFWSQKAGGADNHAVIWDYHVVLLQAVNSTWRVFDLDTTLDFPETLGTYLEQSFRPQDAKSQQFDPFFRLVDAKEFLKHFSSDRSHMLNPEGRYVSKPPQYPCIQTRETKTNLETYISTRQGREPIYGTVFDYGSFEKAYLKR